MTEELLKLFREVFDGIRGAGYRKDLQRGKHEIDLAKTMLTGLKNESPADRFLEGIEEYAKQAESGKDDVMKQRADFYRKRLTSAGKVTASDIARTKMPYFDALMSILHTGLLFAQEAYEKRNFTRVDIEADHLHNVPTYLTSDGDNTIEYYLEKEQPFYLDRIEQYFGMENRLIAEQSFGPFWRSITS